MRVIMVLIIFGIHFLLFTACGGKKVASQWKNAAITVDGQGDDWATIPLLYYDEFKFVMGIANTANTLDIMIRFNDPELAAMIQRRGVTLWIDRNKKKKKTYGVQFIDPSAFERDMMPPVRNRDDRAAPQMNEETLRRRLSRGKFMVVNNDTPQEITGGLKDSIKTAADYQNGLFCFEFGLLFNEKFPSPGEIQIGFELAGLDKERRKEMRMQMERSMNSDAREGGPGGGMRQGDISGKSYSINGKELWLTVLLASE